MVNKVLFIDCHRMKRIISGIQQVGIGVADIDEAFSWYRKIFGTDVIVFRDTAVASLMQRYTGNIPHRRHALLSMNMQGGGGFEIWQFADRSPQPPAKKICIGDTGIFAVKIKSRDVNAACAFHKAAGVNILGSIQINPSGVPHYFLQDPYGNIFEIEESADWFLNNGHPTGAVSGAIIGVNSLEISINFYRDVLGYDVVEFCGEEIFSSFNGLPGGDQRVKRAILSRSRNSEGAFSKLLGKTKIELIELPGNQCSKIYANRFWGDEGFIHVCFDINGMKTHEETCAKYNHPLTVNSCNSFDMGKAAGHFAYNEDPDGTLIEYVETHKVPIIKNMGIYLNLKNRNPGKKLPDWMVKCLAFGRVKD